MPQEQEQDMHSHSSPRGVFERMIEAANRHDLEAMVACYAPDFRSEQPFHPERNFISPEGVRRNWGHFFATMPDHRVEVLDMVVVGDTVWAELRFHGTLADGTHQTTQGVTLVGIRADQFAWARLYIEQVSGE
jgi:ketosteroid isomerase-like protein